MSKAKKSNLKKPNPTSNSQLNMSKSSPPKPNQETKKLDNGVVNNIGANLKTIDEQNQKIAELNDKIKEQQTLITEQKESIETTTQKMIRVLADSENLKKHQELENQQVRKSLKKSIAKNLLEFLNNQFLTLNFLKEVEDDKTKSSLNTLKVSFDTIVSDLAKQSIEFIIPEVGGEFDPESMQVITKTTEEAKVVTIVTLGLRIDGQVIQPASVIL
jgi:molecular chaperone GrpE (heat shock protein)